jgi:molecular chaperone HscC
MILGIDLGTTNSLAAVWRGGEARLIPNALGHVLTPSAVSLTDSGDILVGLPARERLSTHPMKSAAVFKRYMGTGKMLALGDKEFRPEELSALVLRSLKEDAEKYLGETISEAVITVPAYFNDPQRKATFAAGALAGLNVRRLLTEPTAAALAYGVIETKEDNHIIVIDLGGGTFDVSLLHCFDGVMEVRATAGDTWLGGENFVDALVEGFMAEVGAAAEIPPLTTQLPIHAAIHRQAELAKRRLSDKDEGDIIVAWQDREIRWTVSRAHFEQLSEPVLARVRLPIERALRDARIAPDLLSQVILAGGASRMPMFRRLISRLFKRMPAMTINPDEVVARGAAVAAGMLARDADLSEIIMTDVAPFTLGIEVGRNDPSGERMHGLFLPIIERNTVIPASRLQRVHNLYDNQSEIKLSVYQGESRLVAENIGLGELAVKCPPAPRGDTQLDVRFTYDTSGLLEVEATVLNTGVTQTLLLEGNPGLLSQKEIQTRLAALSALKIHPREDAGNRALLARAQRLYEQRLGASRIEIGEAIAQFIAALNGQNPDRIKSQFTRLTRLVESGDDDFFL